MSDCPPDETLARFAQGLLPSGERDRLTLHTSSCKTCAPKLVPLLLAAGRGPEALKGLGGDSMLGDTVARPSSPRGDSQASDSVSGLGTHDTVVSGERSDPGSVRKLDKGLTLDRYVVLERLGGGGMGEVYAAWDPMLDRKVALKLLRGDFQGSPREEEFRLRLLREAQALAKLSHPNVVSIHDVGVAKGMVFLAMEFADGDTLTTWLQKGTRSWRSILEVFLEAGEGLDAAHASGITHRDFKPDNVVVGKDGRVRVMDFGLAHGASLSESQVTEKDKEQTQPGPKRTITAPGTVLGTLKYMSPEALFGMPTDARSDLFSFCVALFEALYGYRPFEGVTPPGIAASIQTGKIRPPPKNTRVPARIHRLILKGLEADPARRFQTLRALLIQLGRRQTERKRATAIALSVAAVVLALGIALGASQRERRRCAGVVKRLDGVWDDEARVAGRAAFLKTGKPWASTAWNEVERQLDVYANTWVGLRRAACEAHDDVSDAQAGRHLVCLSRRMAELDAVAQLFSRADADVVERAVATAGSLPPLELCTRDAPMRDTQKAEHEDLRAGLAAAKARLDAAKYPDAVEKARTVADAAARVDDKATLAEAGLLVALGTARQGDLKTADQILEEAILLATAAQEDDLVGRAWAERVGFAALGAAPPEHGDRWVRTAKAQLERLGNPLELEAVLANNQGVLAWSRGRTEDAIASHQRALELRTRLYGPTSPLTARAHTNLGTDYKAAGRLTEAEAEYRTALAIEERALTPEHPAVAETLNNLANVLLARKDTKGARAAMERALVIKEKESGPESLTVAVTLTNLGALLLDAGELGPAENALTRALRLKEKASGQDSLTVASTLTNLAELLRRQGKWDDAVAADTRALEIRRGRLGAAHKDLASNLTGLGRSWLGAGKADLARAPLEQALRLRTEPGFARGETELWLAKALRAKRGNEGRVKELLEQAVADVPSDEALHLEAKALLEKLGAR